KLYGIEHRGRGDRSRKCIDDGDGHTAFRALRARSNGLHGRLDGLRANTDFQRVGLRTGDGQHDCRRVPEVALEKDRARALWQLAVHRVELEIDVTELPLDVRDVFGKLNVDLCGSGKG